MIRSAALRHEPNAPPVAGDTDELKKAEQFLNDLTEISAKHGIAITGDAVLFVMEPEDYSARYIIDADSNLSRA